MVTYKLKIHDKIDIKEYLKQYNNIVRYSYNRFRENLDYELKDVEKIIQQSMNNIDLMDYTLIKYAVNDASALKTKEKVIFCGNKNFEKRKYNKISNDDLHKYKNKNMMLRGASGDPKGNRKAQLHIIEDNSVKIKFDRSHHIDIKLPRLNKNIKNTLEKLQILCEENKAFFTLRLSEEYINISFDEKILKKNTQREIIGDRLCSLDLNPNYIGLTVIDHKSENEKNIVYKEIIDLSKNNHRRSNKNKSKHETFEVCKHIANLCEHLRVETMIVEKLEMKSKDNKKGKNYNRLVNNCWKRKKIIDNLKKRCVIQDIKILEVLPHYSSFIGQMMNEKEYDSIGASIELARRGYLFKKIYIDKTMQKQDIVYPVYELGSLPTRWKEMVENVVKIQSWKSFYAFVQKSGISYRYLFSLDKFEGNSLRLSSIKSNVLLHNFISDE